MRMAKRRTGTKDKQAYYPRAAAGSAAMALCMPLAELLEDAMEKGSPCMYVLAICAVLPE